MREGLACYANLSHGHVAPQHGGFHDEGEDGGHEDCGDFETGDESDLAGASVIDE